MNKRLLISFSLCLFLYGCDSSKKVLEETDLDNVKLIKSSRYVHAFYNQQETGLKDKKSGNSYDGHNSSKYSSSKQNAALTNDIIQARLSDIPTLFDAQLIRSSDHNGVYYLEYKTALPYQQVMNFYKDEMESCGWLQQMSHSADEVLMLFKKAGRSCIISLRPVKKDWQRSKEIKIILVISH